MLSEGWAGAFDPLKAYQWFTLALAGQKQVMAYDPALDPMAARDRIARDMNENQVKRARLAAENWRPVR